MNASRLVKPSVGAGTHSHTAVGQREGNRAICRLGEQASFCRWGGPATAPQASGRNSARGPAARHTASRVARRQRTTLRAVVALHHFRRCHFTPRRIDVAKPVHMYMLWRSISYHITSHHIMSCHVMPYHGISSPEQCHVVSCRIVSYHIVSCRVVLYRVLS